ncbi:MAG: TetR/AcrR family transcriptional regulator [Sebaldella sp.]|nr:TetR/AcrR family transcriptional regulator [Sebaldella sp.]
MKEDKQKRIMEKGIELFCEVGYLNTTVEKITNSLNISKGSFYTYFESKEALLLSILDFMYINYEKILNKLSEDVGSKELEEILEKYINVMFDSILDSKNIISLIQQVFTNDFFKSEKIKKIVHNFRLMDIEFIKEYIFKKIDFKYEMFDLNLISEYIISSIHTFIIIKMKEGEMGFIVENKVRIVKDIKFLLLYGILKEEL